MEIKIRNVPDEIAALLLDSYSLEDINNTLGIPMSETKYKWYARAVIDDLRHKTRRLAKLAYHN